MYDNIKNKNVMLLDIQYIKQNKKNNTPDVLYTIYKDLDTGEKYLDIKYEPRQDIYFEKPEYRNHSYSKIFAPIDELEVRHVKHKDIIKAIVTEGGPEYKRAYTQAINSGNYQELEKFHLAPFAYATDFDVRVWYRLKWFQDKDNNTQKYLTKGWMDIEVDSIDVDGFPEPEDCPVNAISLVNERDKTVYFFGLVGREFNESSIKNIPDIPKNKKMIEKLLKIKNYYESGLNQQKEAIGDIPELKRMAHEMFDDSYGVFEYKFFFYKDESKMLIDYFKLVNSLKLDFIEVWNMGFDIPYLIKRMTILGLTPSDVMCHPDFPIKQCYYKKDMYHFDIKNKTDFFFCSSYTIFVDQMIIYAAIRKGAQEFRSYKLNTIGQSLLNDEKLNYSDEGSIKTIPYTNYKKFIMYNIKDTLLQCGIERKTDDLDNLYILSYDNLTPYENVFKQTVFLRNLQYKYFLNMGLIPGNNINQILNRGEKDAEQLEEEIEHLEELEAEKEDCWNEEDSDKQASSMTQSFDGALVADPTLNKNNGQLLFGKKSNNIFNLAVDMDMKAFYPNTIQAMNITPNALIYKAYISSNQFVKGVCKINTIFNDVYQYPDLDVAKDVFDNFLTGNYLYSCHKWMNLPSVEDVYNKIKNKMGE